MINQDGRRGQILDAALHVMAEHGFRGASIKRIAERAGLKSPALIYWYFSDKHALFEAMLRRMAPFLNVVNEAEARLDDPPQEVLPRLVASFLERYLRRQTELGRLRPHDPRASARAFMGMLIVYVLGREILPPVGDGFPGRDTYGREVTSIFLNGLSATDAS